MNTSQMFTSLKALYFLLECLDFEVFTGFFRTPRELCRLKHGALREGPDM